MNLKTLTVSFLLMLSLGPCIAQRKRLNNIDNHFRIITVSKKDSRYFETSNGHPWIPIMINFIIPSGNDSYVFNYIEKYFKHFSENGGNAMRIWISSPFLEIEDKKVGEYDPVKFKRIDSILSLAKRYNIQILFVLQHIRTIQPVAPPGFAWANNAFMSLKDGGPFKNIKDYVNTTKGKEAYLNMVRVLSERYKNNKAIFGWELWNEMDAVNADWYSFTKEMLDSVKALFPNQLVVQSLGSMFNSRGLADYKRLLTLKNNDFINLHRYLDMGTKFNQQPIVRAPIDLLVAQAISEVYVPNVVKPVVFEEIGATAPNFTGPSELYKKDTAGVLAQDMIFAPFFCGAAGCGAMWYWNDYVEKNNLWYQYDRFKHAIAGINPIKEKFVPFQFKRDSISCYGLKGNTTTIIWCRDAENNWKTELVEGIKPMVKIGFSLPLILIGKTSFSAAKVYDPWKDKWTNIKIEDGRIKVPPFLRSIVIKLSQ